MKYDKHELTKALKEDRLSISFGDFDYFIVWIGLAPIGNDRFRAVGLHKTSTGFDNVVDHVFHDSHIRIMDEPHKRSLKSLPDLSRATYSKDKNFSTEKWSKYIGNI